MDSQQVFVVPQVPVATLPMAATSHTTLSTPTPTPLVSLQMSPQCAICGTTQKLLRCAKCKTIYYCSTDHQHLDWPTHKQECRQLAKQRQFNGRDRSLQQLTNGCSAININSNSILNTCSQSSNSGNWPLNYTAVINNHHRLVQSASQSPSPSHVLGTNENEILNSIAESVTQNSSTYMDNFVANSTTCNQMHDMQINHKTFATEMEGNQFVDNLGSYQNMTAVQQQSPYNGTMETYQQQSDVQLQQGYNTSYTQTHEMLPPLSNHLINLHEKSSSYQIGAAAFVDESAMENANERRYEELCRNIINDMNQYGLSVVDDFLGREKGMQILNEALNMYSAGVFKDGQLVNNFKSEQDLKTIRGDKITWVKGVEPGCSNVGYLINQIDAVICRANTMLNNGKLGNYVIKERTKAMVACYPGSGSHYVMHVDNPNKDGRVITAIYYLNVNWDSRDSGGVLRIFPEQAKSVADIEPKFDRLIFFWSDKRNPHEVQPAHRTRYAITVWYFDANEREAALNRCKNSQSSYNKVTNNFSNSGSSPCSSTDTPNNSSTPATNSQSNTNLLDNTTNNTSSACPFKSSTSSSTASICIADDHDDASKASTRASLAAQVRPIQVVLPNCYK